MRDIGYSFRAIVKQPVFSGIVILTFALGIGANSAVFSVLNAVLLRPLPFHQPHELVALGEYDTREKTDPGSEINSISYLDYVDLGHDARVFERVAIFTNQAVGTLSSGDQAIHVQGEAVSADLFPLLGVQPMLGRSFRPNEDGPGNHVVILSHDLWQRQFGGDRGILGKSINLDGQSFQIVGVMPSRFRFPINSASPELWITTSVLQESKDGSPAMTEQRDNDFFSCIARLKPGVSIQQAQANVDTIAANWQRQYPDAKLHVGAKVIPEVEAMIGSTHSALLMLCATAGCVLLVACVNVANLLLARSSSRRREISIRAALGASRSRIIKQLLVESILLGICGGIAGLFVAIWGLDLLKAFLPNIPRMEEISPDPRVLAFTAFVSLTVGAIAGLLPAWRASHPSLSMSLSEASRGSSEGGSGRRMRATLVVVEIVLALVLLASAGLLIKTFVRLQRVPAGFDTANVVTARIALPQGNYGKPEQAAEFFKKLLRAVSSAAGVQSAGAAWWIPLSGSEISLNFNIEEHPVATGQQPLAQVNVVTPDYFQTVHASIKRGRSFTERDDRTAPPVVIVSESFAKQFFPGEDPIGKRITPNGSVDPGKPQVREIVGVVADMHLISLRQRPKPQIYMPHQQFAVETMALFVRSQMSSESVMMTLRNAVKEIDKDVPVYRVRTLADYASTSIAQPRLNAMLVGLFALIALLLAAAGVFGAMSYSVNQRVREIGIRLALGAQRGDVFRLIVRQGMQLVLVGVAGGLLGISVSARLLQSLLFGIAATDIQTIFMVTVFLCAIGLIACWFPALRASQVDPVHALRGE